MSEVGYIVMSGYGPERMFTLRQWLEAVEIYKKNIPAVRRAMDPKWK